MLELSIIGTAYIILNLYVTRRINKSYYLNDQRRAIHKILIWFLPFIGPLLIMGFWRKERKVKFDTMTKDQRKKSKGDFYESGIGLNG
jgi:hypothetical protein